MKLRGGAGRSERARQHGAPKLKRRSVPATAPLRTAPDEKLKRQAAKYRNELKQALEQQMATSEVLRIIAGSRGELQPVFQAILENAVRVCEAKVALPPAFSEFIGTRGSFRPGPETTIGRVLQTKEVAHWDAGADDSIVV